MPLDNNEISKEELNQLLHSNVDNELTALVVTKDGAVLAKYGETLHWICNDEESSLILKTFAEVDKLLTKQ